MNKSIPAKESASLFLAGILMQQKFMLSNIRAEFETQKIFKSYFSLYLCEINTRAHPFLGSHLFLIWLELKA